MLQQADKRCTHVHDTTMLIRANESKEEEEEEDDDDDDDILRMPSPAARATNYC